MLVSRRERRHVLRLSAFALMAALTCAGLVAAALLASAPPVITTLIVAVCLACPLIAAWELAPAIEVLRHSRRSISELRRQVDRLPETRHPLGF